jgi:gamma-glutamyltranspeptidase / glutathione hydrolase
VDGSKRPRSSMAPTVVFDPEGRLMMAAGAAGGSTIPVQVARVLIGVIDFGLTVDQALALPVLYSPGETVFVEQGTALEAMIPQLEALGHGRVVASPPGFKANAAVLTGDEWVGGADPRSEGAAVSE